MINTTGVRRTGVRSGLRRGSALAAALVAVVLGLLFAASGPASAKPYPPTPYPPTSPYSTNNGGCTVSTTTANAGPGSQVTFVGNGFKANSTVTISVPSASAALGSAKTTAGGTFTATFTWPASVAGASAVVQASAPSTTCSFTLVNHKNQATHHSGSGGLSSTGFQALTATTIALVLIGSGAIFLGLARRKRA